MRQIVAGILIAALASSAAAQTRPWNVVSVLRGSRILHISRKTKIRFKDSRYPWIWN